MIGDDQADALGSMPRCFQDADRRLPKVELKSILHRDVRKLRSGLRAHVDGRTGAGCQFPVAGNKVGVQVTLKNVPDGDSVISSGLQVQLDVALRIDYHRFTFRSQEVGSMRQTSQIELFEIHGSPPRS